MIFQDIFALRHCPLHAPDMLPRYASYAMPPLCRYADAAAADAADAAAATPCCCCYFFAADGCHAMPAGYAHAAERMPRSAADDFRRQMLAAAS